MEAVVLSEDGRVVLPQPNELSKREKEDAMGAYLMMFASMGVGLPLPVINLIASIIYFFMNKNKSRFVAFHSLQSLITQIPISLLNAGVIFWFIRNIIIEPVTFSNYFWAYLIFTGLWNVVYFFYSIVACVKAYKGCFFYMLLFGGFVFDIYYGDTAIQKSINPQVKENLPPKGF